MEEEAERNCEALIQRALSVAPDEHEVQLTLASIRMSQSRPEEAKAIAVRLCQALEGKEPCMFAGTPFVPGLSAPC